MTLYRICALACAICLAMPIAAQGAEPAPGRPLDQAVFGFGGLMVDDDMGTSALLFTPDYEDNVIFGIGYQRFLERVLPAWTLGLEAGLAGRFGQRPTVEAWGGYVLRHDSFKITRGLSVTPAMTVGLSAVSHTIGREAEQQRLDGGDATVLFYLGPELNLSDPRSDSGHEVFWRLHHRSGAGGTLGGMRGAGNANVFGLRRHF
ncbi:hypothetical protein [Aureimonas frigidaquae]|uniref:Lipid A 3-O-deacylase n=1 Tax=Aureimonas frigidaquae TaxID=424757 RepID=A0A0P0Z0E4_9HYPH|nr:hypothetical protein [Aureimonas frigidaquae]BAT27306.1 hypothetical protein [Aureimonas frigidaquae]